MIAYEPVWAIGTGEVASVDDIAAMHQAIASELPKSQNGHKGTIAHSLWRVGECR